MTTLRQTACGVIFVAVLAPRVEAVCPDWSKSGRFADIDASAVVFEGVVKRIEQDATRDCAPDRVVFKVSRVWKGETLSEYVLLQSTERTHEIVIDGHPGIAGCPMWVEQDTFYAGRPYIVFASGEPGKLESMGCGLSRAPSKRTRTRLDAWLANKAQRSRGATQHEPYRPAVTLLLGPRSSETMEPALVRAGAPRYADRAAEGAEARRGADPVHAEPARPSWRRAP